MKSETEAQKLIKKSMELFSDEMLSEVGPEEYARILEENLAKKKVGKELRNKEKQVRGGEKDESFNRLAKEN